MVRKISTIFIMVMLFTVISKAQWTYEGVWPDTNYKGGTHGIVVAPDGKVWTASYYGTNGYWPVLVFSADGTTVDTLWAITTGGVTDSLLGNTRGMGQDEEGNILLTTAAPSRIYKIDYQTMEGIAMHVFTEIGSSPTAPGVSDDGTVFVGPVVGGGTTAIAMYDVGLSYLGNAVVGPANIARTMEVSGDGLTIYWTMFTGTMGIDIYTRPSVFDAFTKTDSIFYGMSIETAEWNPVSGLLWVSNDSRGYDSTKTHLTWYGIDVTTNTIVDSFTLPSPDPLDPVDELPRGLAFSADGNTAYVGLFGTKYDRLYKFSKATDVKPDPNTVVEDYNLSQNYPNPFNPTTEIKFTVAKEGFVTLKVYDILGKEVANLVSEQMPSGAYSADFNASELSSGTYIYTLSVNGVSISKKMMLLK